jgi:hypothetical protein
MRIIPGKKMRINHAQPKAAKAHRERRSNVPATRVPEGSQSFNHLQPIMQTSPAAFVRFLSGSRDAHQRQKGLASRFRWNRARLTTDWY